MRPWFAVCAGLLAVMLGAPACAVATEATLTEVVEAVKADTAAVEAVKGEIAAGAAQAHTDAGTVASLLKAPVAVAISGEPTVKVGNWEGAPSGGTVELTGTAKEVIGDNANTMHDDFWFLIGTLFAMAAAFVLYSELRPRS